MFRPEFVAAPDHNAIHLRHRALHEMPRNMAKKDVTTIDGQVFSVVYTTAQPTFTGVIGGYTTDTNAASSSSARTLAAPAIASASPTGTSADYPQETQQQTSTSSSQDETAAATSSFSQVTSSSAASSSNNYSYGSSTGSTLSTTGTSDSSNSSTSSDSAGMSTAGKAGLVVGIIFAIGAVLGLILLLLSKKKKQAKAEQARQDSEKNDAIAAGNASKSLATAPRLSFRPASSFMPEFMGRPKSRLSQGNMMGATSNEGNAMREKYLASSTAGQQAIPLTEKPAPAENPFKDPENPFADPVRAAPKPAAPQPAPGPIAMPAPAAAPAAPPAPIPMPEPAPAPVPVAMPSPVSTVSSGTVAAAAVSAGAVAAARSAMGNNDAPRQPAPQQENARPDSARQEPIEMPTPPIGVPAGPPTPKSAVSDSPRAGPPPESNVYRILMDFSPSMEDELELKAGQVVRMLHEYDDGWCLCTRLDHSQQGVVPRTCLASRPSKPRPAPGHGPRPMSPAMGPPGPNGQPMSTAMRQGRPPQGRPMSPGMGRPMSPANGPRGQRPMSPGPRGPPPPGMRPMSPGAYNQPPRPLSPGPRASKRSQSPGPYGSAGGPAPMAQQRPRSNSSGQIAREVRERRQSPPGPSPLGGAGLGLAL